MKELKFLFQKLRLILSNAKRNKYQNFTSTLEAALDKE